MSRLSDTALYKYEPRLLSRSMTILKPSSKTCRWIVSRTFDGAVVLGFSLFVVRLRDEVASASTDGILIVDRNLSRQRGQRGERGHSAGIVSRQRRGSLQKPGATPQVIRSYARTSAESATQCG